MSKSVKRRIAFLLSLVMVLGIFPFNIMPLGFAPLKAEAAVLGGFNIEGDSTGYGYSSNVLTISGGGTYNVSMAPGTSATTDTIKVTSGNDVTLVLDSVQIATNDQTARAPIEVNATGKVTIQLAGESTLTSGHRHYAALQKTSTGNQLVITSAEGDGSTSGKLVANANGNYAAAIGGGNQGAGNNITIAGGTIEATAKNQGAGIGGGSQGAGSNITITGGKVAARSNGSVAGGGAGIGGGTTRAGSNITISGGEVTASGYRGAGIGGGHTGSGSNITISGGEVIATGTSGGAGIGGGRGSTQVSGDQNAGNYIEISGGKVKATSDDGAGIGGGDGGSGSNITITGGEVTATGTSGGAGIGGGNQENGSVITVSGGKAKGNNGAGIG